MCFPRSRNRIDLCRTAPLRNSQLENRTRRFGHGKCCCADTGPGSSFGSRNCDGCCRTARTAARLTTALSSGGNFLSRSTVISQRQRWRQYRRFGSRSSDAIGVISRTIRASDHPESRRRHCSTHLVYFLSQKAVEHSLHHQKIRLDRFGGTNAERIPTSPIYFLIWSNEGFGGGVPVNTKTSAVNDLRVRLRRNPPARWQRFVLLRAAPTPGETKRSSGSSGVLPLINILRYA